MCHFFLRNNKRKVFAAEKTIRLEMLHQPSIQFSVFKVITMKDEVFMLFRLHG